MRFSFLFLVIVSCVFAELKQENGIYVLNDSNFQKTVKENESMFIEFYSSKQPDSLRFISTLEAIVKRFEEKDIHPMVAKIDHGKSPEIARIYRIGKFPVIYHFKKGSPRFFDGEMVEDQVELFMEKFIHPDVVLVTKESEIQAQIERGFPVVVGHFNKKSSKEYKNYRKACSVFTDYITLAVIGENSDVSVPMNQVDIYADGVKRTYSDKMTVKELKKWISIKSLPPIIPYQRKYMKIMFAKDNGVFDHLLFISNKEYLPEHPEVRSILEKVAEEFTARLFVVNLYDSEQGMMEFFGVDMDKLPTLTLVKNGDNEVSKYAFRGEFEESAIRDYIKAYFDGTLEPYYKSEEPYTERDGNVKVLVGKDFEEYVYNPNKNVLVEFVASRCPRCDELHNDIDVLAGYFTDVPDIDVARIDVTKNDVRDVEMRSYPMFYFYPAGEEQSHKMYDKEADIAGLLRFIKENRVKVQPEKILETMMDPEKEVDLVDDELFSVCLMRRFAFLDKESKQLKFGTGYKPKPSRREVLIRVLTCGICRTDLHVIDGDLPDSLPDIIPGHQIVGIVQEVGEDVTTVGVGDQIGVPWLGGCCGSCTYCTAKQENLCDHAIYTGYQKHGGFADYCIADASFCFPIPSQYSPIQAAPLLCAGLIGYRSFRKTGSPRTLGLYGFGSSAHIVIQIANLYHIASYVFTRDGDSKKQAFAKELGAVWAGGSSDQPPVPLDACIIFASEGPLVVRALEAVRKGGIVVCAGIHMTDIPSFPYSLLWNEKRVESVANLTVNDGKEFFELISENPLHMKVNCYKLEEVNQAIDDLRHGRLTGSAVIVVDESCI